MADSPLFTNDVPFSIVEFIGDGVTSTRSLSFAGGYISRDHIKAFQTEASGETTEVTLTWVGDYTVEVSPVTPDDVVLTIYRDTPKGAPTVNFVQGAVINEPNLDELAQQAVFVSAELSDRFQIVYETSELAATQADEAIIVSEEAADTASIALGNSETALLLATTTANQFEELAGSVEDLVGGDVSNFALRNGNNTFVGSNEFSVAPTVPTQTGSDDSLKVANTAFVQAKAVSTLATAANDATAKANAAQAAAAVDATAKAAFVQTTAANDATAKVNALDALVARKAAPDFTGGMSVDGSGDYNVIDLTATDTINVSSADLFKATRSVNTTFVFTGAIAGRGEFFALKLVISGGATITWPANVKQDGNVPAAFGNGTHVIGFLSFDGGTTWELLRGLSY